MISNQCRKNKLYIEQLNENAAREKLLIDSGVIYRTICNCTSPISDVELAMQLDLSIANVRNVMLELERDNLVERNFQGDWSEVEF